MSTEYPEMDFEEYLQRQSAETGLSREEIITIMSSAARKAFGVEPLPPDTRQDRTIATQELHHSAHSKIIH